MKIFARLGLMLAIFLLFFAGNKKQKASTQTYACAVPIPAWDADNEQFRAYPLSASAIGRTRITVDKPFSKTIALRKLFPGNFYSRSPYGNRETVDVVAWQCNDCRVKYYKGWYDDDMIEFPQSLNVTEARDTLFYTDDNNSKHLILSLATHHNTEYIIDIYGDHYSPVAMSLAWFTLNDGKWALEAFEPCIGMYGTYQVLPKIKLLKLGKNNFGCYIKDGTGAPGMPYIGKIYVFGRENGRIKRLLEENKVERDNSVSSIWSFRLKSATSVADSMFEPLEITVKGKYIKNTPDKDWDFTDHPAEMTTSQLAKDSLNFKVVRKFQFSNGKYRKVSGKISVWPPAIRH